MIKALALTGGKNVPSARYRIQQYIPLLKQASIDLQEAYPTTTIYPPSVSWKRPLWALKLTASNIARTLQSHRYDLTILQREMMSAHRTFECFTHKPRILDVDDAIFLLNDDHFIHKIAARCDLVICGNTFLANHFQKWCANIKILPTGIDITRYTPSLNKRSAQAPFIIGWTGTQSNFRYLYHIEDALAQILKIYPHVQLALVANAPPAFHQIPPNRIQFIPWNRATEIKTLQKMDVGIMPLLDTPWARGKCSFKVVQYMATGLPFVASPVGFNREIFNMGQAGIAATTTVEWVSALTHLIEDETTRLQLGQQGRIIAENHFSIQALNKQFAAYLTTLC